ncbi:MAG: carbon monoxide dehydrogenase, partial [bacterium]
MAKEFNCEEVTECKATLQMLKKADRDGVDTAFHRAHSMSACPIGEVSACCKHCAMGPCRLSPKDPNSKVGVCGATYDTIASRNFARMVAAGTASHTDHGMALLALFREVAQGHNTAYKIKDVKKLRQVAQSVGIEVQTGDEGSRTDRDTNEIAEELADKLQLSFTQVEGEIPFASRVPEKTLETWRKEGIVPRGAMLEVMELMHRSHMGMDQDYENIMTQSMRTALADGWAGSMVGTEIADILYGNPKPIRTEVDMGCLSENKVNIIIHGHEPTLFESMIDAVNDDTLINKANAAGAEGINLLGMCCSGAEALMRHGIPHAGSFMSTEAVIITGAVDAMAVDVQCIKQGLLKMANCYGTKFFTTNRRAKVSGAEHIELDEARPEECCHKIVEMAVERYQNRNTPIEIPQEKHEAISGFNHEVINYMLGGRFRESYKPLNDN